METKAELDLHTKQTGQSAQKICNRAGLRKLRTSMTESERIQRIQTITAVQTEAIIRGICADHSHLSQIGGDETSDVISDNG